MVDEKLFTFYVDDQVHALHMTWAGIMSLVNNWGPGNYKMVEYIEPNSSHVDCPDYTLEEEAAAMHASLESDDDYGNCIGCGSQEPREVLDQMEGYCSSQCEREDREARHG